MAESHSKWQSLLSKIEVPSKNSLIAPNQCRTDSNFKAVDIGPYSGTKEKT